jgi:hypothetical protein
MERVMHGLTTLNRRQRRALRGQRPDLVVAVHEAGHCVGRVLTAPYLGRQPQEIIKCIEIHPPGDELSVLGLAQCGRCQAITLGPFLSKPMQGFFAKQLGEKRRAANQPSDRSAELWALIPKMRKAGIDVDSWFRATTLQAICGPMAEARLIEKEFEAIWNDECSELDLNGTVCAGCSIGLDSGQIASVIEEMVDLAKAQFTRFDVWQAIMSLSAQFKFGRNSGREAAEIILRQLKKGIE